LAHITFCLAYLSHSQGPSFWPIFRSLFSGNSRQVGPVIDWCSWQLTGTSITCDHLSAETAKGRKLADG